jgi:hypothetical protein
MSNAAETEEGVNQFGEEPNSAFLSIFFISSSNLDRSFCLITNGNDLILTLTPLVLELLFLGF